MVSLQNFLQLDDYNGVPLAAGKVYVYHQGRETLAEIYADINGETPIANPAILNSLGMQEIYVSNVYNYTVVVTDPYNNELFSRDIYPNGVDGDGNNRLYEGLDPICVNNDKMVISAKKATLSVQDPLYFVEDSSSAVCIGIENSAFEGLPYIENSAIELDPSGNISAISGYPFHSDSADNATSAESAGIVTDGWETGSDGRITAYNGTAFSAGKVYSGIDPIYVDNENDQIGVSSKDFLANAPLYFTEYNDRVELSISGLPDTPGLMYESSFNYESGKITGYHGSAISAGKVYSGIDPIHVDNDNDTISLDSATLGVQAPLYFVEDSESATIIGLDSAQVVTPTIPVSGINGIKISESADTVLFEVSGNYVDYSAIDGTDNVITGINGSALSAGANYSAGDNIVIDNNTISVASAITLVDPVTLRMMHANGKNTQFIDYSGDAGATVDPSGLYVSDINETAFTLVDKELVTIRNASGSVDMSNMAPGPSIDLIRMSGNTPVSNIQMHTQDHQYPEFRAYIRATDKDSATSSYNQLDLNTVDVSITHLPDNNDPALYRHYSLTGACSSAASAIDILNTGVLTTADSGNFATTGDLNDLVTSIAETYQPTAGMTAYANSADVTGTAQYGLTTAGWSEITGGGGVSGTNVIFEPHYEGATHGDYYSATISGDVIVTKGYYDNNGAEIHPMNSYSLSSIGANLGNKLDKNKIEDSNTIAIIDNHAEVTDKAYRQTGFSDISAYYVDVRLDSVTVDFRSIDAGLYSAIVTVETTASAESIPDGWSLVSYENNSATFTRYYPLNNTYDSFRLDRYQGWGDFTNAEASATVYSALEIAPLAFKDDITGITYTTGSI